MIKFRDPWRAPANGVEIAALAAGTVFGFAMATVAFAVAGPLGWGAAAVVIGYKAWRALR